MDLRALAPNAVKTLLQLLCLFNASCSNQDGTATARIKGPLHLASQQHAKSVVMHPAVMAMGKHCTGRSVPYAD